MDTPWMLAGGAAIAGLLATCWSHLRGLYAYFVSWMVISISVQGYQSDALQLMLRDKFTASKFGPRLYTAWLLHVRTTRRTQLVTMEVIGSGGRLFWLGRRPLWVAKSNESDSSMTESGVTARDYESNTLTVTFLRGMFQVDRLVSSATDHYNRRMVAFDEYGMPQTTVNRRHYVRHVFGSAGKALAPLSGSRSNNQGPTTAGDTRSCMHHRPIGYSFDELGSEPVGRTSPIEQLALDCESSQLVDEIKFWKSSEHWYRKREIPWRRGVLLHGPPGSGKTALIRAIAEELDLPVFIFDLASLHNKELQEAWSKMLSETPCMAVIEDIDSVFHGRKNVVSQENQTLTFDSLLNCLDGIQRSNGLFVAITTNHVDQIDPALGVPQDGISTRPGRIDRTLYLGCLSESSRLKIARRIIPERVDLQERLVIEGDGDMAAQFQERCTRVALESFWGKERSNWELSETRSIRRLTPNRVT